MRVALWMDAISWSVLGGTWNRAQDLEMRGRLAVNLFEKKKRAVHLIIGHPLSFMGPTSPDTAIAGVELVFIDSRAVRKVFRPIRYRCRCRRRYWRSEWKISKRIDRVIKFTP